ncbi:hypothetical protein Srot_2350 [Segniliparus rotundus DSM 44985]|uniref:Holliday junction resolvase n=1 Tax=Segniliparus rotundus (strain ATCC BAA-972 / CDC 1076 / CIP 108378 / DSM 44985 / JCM 13578) TaxID=640132 RepID=D6ZAR2_SEGRD|nr:hypothetical protein [Segniliparus rotundus]ADG98798.1 hypothetical protein Srot_2350 [Segniliparus rotundus DSM 44985]
MTNRMKAKGDRAERAVKDMAAANGFPWCERLKAGDQRDKGDLSLAPGVIAQVKDRKTLSLRQWLVDTEAQRVNARADVGVLVVKLASPGKAPVWAAVMELPGWLSLARQAGWGEPLEQEADCA